ncbi:MAG: TolC family protein, partial [Bacteroidetes bacterium]|nr:TolC family protein [Bacteroidota bacterium]
ALSYQVKSAFTQLTYYLALQKLYENQDTIYNNFRRAATFRYQAGETNLLEQKTAETQYNEVVNQMVKNQANIAIYASEIQKLLNSNQTIQVADTLKKTSWDENIMDSTINSNPILALQRQEIELADKRIGVVKAEAGPDFNIGYFNQSIIGNYAVNGQNQYYGASDRFQGVQAGVSIPIFFKPYSSRVKAAKIEKQVAQSDFNRYETDLSSQFKQAYQDMLKGSKSLDYYQNSALPNANLILTQSQIAFQNGEIGYVEYLQALRTYSDIKFNYLQTVNDYNQSVFTLQYLIGL